MLPVQCIAMIFPFYDNHTFANHLHQQNWRARVSADKFKGCASANHRFHFHFHFDSHSHFHFLSMINDQQNWRTDDKFKGCANVQAPIIGIHSLAKCNRALRPLSLCFCFYFSLNLDFSSWTHLLCTLPEPLHLMLGNPTKGWILIYNEEIALAATVSLFKQFAALHSSL